MVEPCLNKELQIKVIHVQQSVALKAEAWLCKELKIKDYFLTCKWFQVVVFCSLAFRNQ
jgi:hypothetical protein